MARDRSEGGGFICVWRSFREHRDYFTNRRRPATTQEAIMDLWLSASYETQTVHSQGEYITVERGQVLTSILALSQRWRWSRARVEHLLDRCEASAELVQKRGTRRTLITLSNYCKWQDVRTQHVATDRQLTGSRSATEKHVEPSEPSEPSNHLTKKTSPRHATPDDGFAVLWAAYPKKVGKADARKAWDRLNGSKPELSAVLEAIRWQAATQKWHEEGGRFIPNPATWINQQRWLDEPTCVEPPKPREPKGMEGIREYIRQRTGRSVSPERVGVNLAQPRDDARVVPPLLGGGEAPDEGTVHQGGRDRGEEL